MHHMKALLWKNFLWMWRNIPTMTFIIGLPVAQIILFCLSIGHDPVDLPVAVVNYELDTRNVCVEDLNCNGTTLSCSYLGYLERRALKLVSDRYLSIFVISLTSSTNCCRGCYGPRTYIFVKSTVLRTGYMSRSTAA